MMFERITWWTVGRLLFYASWREKYKSPKILFVAFILFIYLIIYLFIYLRIENKLPLLSCGGGARHSSPE
jgi:hypothetical protein